LRSAVWHAAMIAWISSGVSTSAGYVLPLSGPLKNVRSICFV
jgi:hypothetical protein